jgi:dTMP kinase
VIQPMLSAGGIVLCDRFIDATYAYQGYGRGLDLGIIGTLNRLVTKGVTPNLTVLVDCEVETGLKRKLIDNPLSDRFEKEDVSFHEKIRSAYLKLAKEDKKRFFVVDGQQGVEVIHLAIRDKVEKLLESHGV